MSTHGVLAVFVAGGLLGSLLLTTRAEDCVAGAINSPTPAGPYYTAWYNSDTPDDGVDTETLSSVKELDSGVCDFPVDVECRARISQLSLADTGQTLAQDCTNAANGLQCQNIQQGAGEVCHDYEIRFRCPAPAGALPAPSLHWEMNGRTSASDTAPTDCSNRKKLTTKVYSSVAGVADGVLNSATYSTLIIDDAPSASRHVCALMNYGTAQVDLGTFEGICISEPSCCASGATISVWIKFQNPPVSVKDMIVTSGGNHGDRRGFAIRTASLSGKRLMQFYVNDDTDNMVAENSGNPEILIDQWQHYIFTWIKGTKNIYVDGTLVYSSTAETSASRSNSPKRDKLTLFAPELNFNKIDKSQRLTMSDLKVFYTRFDNTEVQKLYTEETTAFEESSEDNVRILAVSQVSDPSDPNLLVECLARGPSQNNEPTINWYILDEDGFNWLALTQSSSNFTRYDSSVSDNYRTRSVLQWIEYQHNHTIVCEAVDAATGSRTSFKFVPDIECRAKYTEVAWDLTGQQLAVPCTIEGGLVCSGSQQLEAHNFTCFDYEVRLLCPQETIYWTQWYDVSNVDATGDDEKYTAHLSSDSTLCLDPLFAQCREVGSEVIWTPSSNSLSYPYVCATDGLVCLEADNSGCQDYEVRYACPSPAAVPPTEYWDLSGRASVNDPQPPGTCGTHVQNTIISNTGGPSAVQGATVLYTDAPSQLPQKCAFLTGTSGGEVRGLNLGSFAGECLSKVGWCADGMTVSLWMKQNGPNGGSKLYFFGSGSEIMSSTVDSYTASNGFGFFQKNTLEYVAKFRSDGRKWNDVIVTGMTSDVWHHVTLTFDDVTGGRGYIDGVFRSSGSTHEHEFNSLDSLNRFLLGTSNEDDENANAAYSDVMFFEKELNDEEILTLFYCQATFVEAEVTSVNRTSHHFNSDLTLTCDVRGRPITGITWSWTQSLDPPMPVVDLSNSMTSITIVESGQPGCDRTSTLTYQGFPRNQVENATFFCTVNYQNRYDRLAVEVQTPVCERSLGFEDGSIRLLQITSNPFAGLAIQGSASDFVASYRVSYRDTTSDVWSRNLDFNGGQGTVWQTFDPVIESRYLRVNSRDTDGNDEINLEFYGCATGNNVLQITNTSSSYNPSTNTYTLWCEGSYYPPPTVTWLADGQVITGEPRYVETSVEGVLTLNKRLDLTGFVLTDEDVEFSCLVEANGFNMTQVVNTEYGFTGQVIVTNLTNIVHDETVLLQCTADNDDVYTMDWYFSNETIQTPVLLTSGNGMTISGFTAGDSPGVSTLTITNYDEQDDGTYICSVNRDTGRSNFSSFGAGMTVSVDPPVFNESQLFYTITCHVQYFQEAPSSVEWTLPNGTVITGQYRDGVYDVTETAGASSIVSRIILLSGYLAGTYTCTGRSSIGSSVDSVSVDSDELTVTHISGAYNFTKLFYWMECAISFGGSQPRVSWLTPEGASVNQSADDYLASVTVGAGTINLDLQIYSTDYARYDGTYRCKATGAYREAEQDVVVKYAYEGSLTIQATSGFVLGDDVRITCSAANCSYVHDISWSRIINASFAHTVVEGDVFRTIEVRGQEYCTSYLDIFLFSRLDEGTYRCDVNSGSKSKNISLSAPDGKTKETN
ncbi:uncharacterized protein [Diadema antillarum]|uniref:uncharacterized protein n=1 Tax=Diadema antillarum TaxID=105358 RepID=UPI003A8C8397